MMSPSESEEEPMRQSRIEPLCFYQPRTNNHGANKSYLSLTNAAAPTKIRTLATSQTTSNRTSGWKLPGGRRSQMRAISSSDETSGQSGTRHRRGPPTRSQKTGSTKKIKAKRRMTKGAKNLKSHLLANVQSVTESAPVSSLTNVLETITDAWPCSNNLQDFKGDSLKMSRDGKPGPVSYNVLERRRSVPEEVIRKFSVSHEKTSESETNATMPEMTPPTSKGEADEHEKKCEVTSKTQPVARRKVLERSFRLVEDPCNIRSAEEGSSDSDSNGLALERFNTIKRAPLRRGSVVTSIASIQATASDRASQSDYIRNGRGIINIPATEKASQTGNCYCREVSDTTPSPTAREETESAATSETISSPRLCTQHLSSSENQSSDSEEIKCTCAELVSSRDTSTDPNHSGKSTLSQSVSDKSTSTQDCTISINSVSSRGSTITAATDTSSTEADPKTSAKETTDNDQSPRPPNRRENNGNDGGTGGGGNTSNNRQAHNNCPQHGPTPNNSSKYGEGHKNHGTERYNDSTTRERKMKLTNSCTVQTMPTPHLYHWTQLSQEEVTLIKQQRDKKALETNYINKLPLKTERKCDIFVNSGKNYETSEFVDSPIMVPRYSAMPKTMSMIVNASSFEANNYSDSDCQSLADSLEDGENGKDVQCYYDTKQELKPVRGDFQVNNTKKYRKEPRGRAYFFSMDDEGVADLETNIYRIPEMPDGLKNKIQQRHDDIHKKYENKESNRDESRDNKISQRTIKKCHKKRTLRTKRVDKEDCNTTPPTTRLNYSNSKLAQKNPKQELQKKDEKLSPRLLSKIPAPISTNAKDQKSKVRSREDPPRDMQTSTEDLTQLSENGAATTKKDENELIDSPSKGSNSETCTIQDHVIPVDVDALTRHRLSLISSLEATALILKAQTAESEKGQPSVIRLQPGSKRPAKFRQKFEVIPEERSSSLSSADERHSEKTRRRSLPVKLTEPIDVSTKTTDGPDAEGKAFRRYSLDSLSNYVIAKLMGKPLQAIPCVQRGPNNENQRIIIFSPKDSSERNSSKGRDALLAMNREDFERLSKGWMNFYLLKDDSVAEGEKGETELSHENKQLSQEMQSAKCEKPTVNSIICRLPSMERDPPTTSGSGTDETSVPPCTNCVPSVEGSSLMLKTENNSICEEQFTNVEHKEQAKEVKVPTSSSTKEKGVGKHDNVDNSRIYTSQDIELPVQLKKLTKEASTSTEKNYTKIKKHSESVVELSIPMKLSSSNTVLKSKTTNYSNNTPKSSSRTGSLPELRTPTVEKSPPTIKCQSSVNSLPRVPGATTESDGDSDSTVYMNAPSPHLPKLPLEDCCCSSEDSSDLEELESKTISQPRERAHLPLRRRPLPFRPKHRFGFYESVHGKKPGNSGWSVTVEGTMAFPRTRPDVQMRLSFPDDRGGPPVISQSDSGFVEDRTTKPRTASQQKQQWTVTVKNPQTVSGGMDKQRTSCRLPNLTQQNQKTVRSSKMDFTTGVNPDEVKHKLSAVWPQIEEIIEKELNSITWDISSANRAPLSVEGRTIPLDRKPRASKMSGRDLTRRSIEGSEVLTSKRTSTHTDNT